MNFKKITALTLSLSATSILPAHEYMSARPDSHAPISVMGDHVHKTGEWMASYRYMLMDMDGMRAGTDALTAAEVFMADGGYTVTPESMTMDMHMLGLMYALNDDITFLMMANYTSIEMEHQINPMAAPLINANGGSGNFTTKSEGVGDVRLGALYQFYSKENKRAHLGLALSLPTGSIDETDFTPMPGMPPSFVDQVLPAPMQLGSGTIDLLPSITWLHQFEDWSYGVQASGKIRMESENDRGYQLGNVFELIHWIGYAPNNSVSLEGGIAYKHVGGLSGTQEDIGTMGPAGRSVTTAFNENYGGESVDLIAGLNFLFENGHRLAFDVRAPVWQDLNGLQLETDYTLTLGWQKAW